MSWPIAFGFALFSAAVSALIGWAVGRDSGLREGYRLGVESERWLRSPTAGPGDLCRPGWMSIEEWRRIHRIGQVRQ